MQSLHNVKTQLVELFVQGIPSTGNQGTRFYFNDQPFLRSKPIISLETYFFEDSAGIGSSGGMISPANNPVVTAAIGTSSYLTLYGNDPETPPKFPQSGQTTAQSGVVAQGEWIQQFPLSSLHRVNDGTKSFVYDLSTWIPRIIIWEKSYVTLPIPSANTANYSFIFNVGYIGIDTSVS